MTVSNNSTLSGNHAELIPVGYGSGPSGFGGGVYNSGGTMAISQSTLSDNAASDGGGIYVAAGTLTVENSSSIAGNTAPDVYILGVLYLDSTSTIGALDGNPATPI